MAWSIDLSEADAFEAASYGPERASECCPPPVTDPFFISAGASACPTLPPASSAPIPRYSASEIKKQERETQHAIDQVLVKIKGARDRYDRLAGQKEVLTCQRNRKRKDGVEIARLVDARMPEGDTFTNGFLHCLQPYEQTAKHWGDETKPLNIFPCGNCRFCNANRRNNVLGRLMAQACQSTHLLCFTLTYDPEKYAEYRNQPDPDHIARFYVELKRWIRKGYRKAGRQEPVIKACRVLETGEGLSGDAHCHYHVVVFIEGEIDGALLHRLNPQYAFEDGAPLPERELGIVKGERDKATFNELRKDRETLYFPNEMARKYRQHHHLWKYGTVNIDVLGKGFRPISGEPVFYLCKYVRKGNGRFRLPKACGERAIVAHAKARGRAFMRYDMPFYQVEGFKDIRHRTERIAAVLAEKGEKLFAPQAGLQVLPLSGVCAEKAVKAHLHGWRNLQKMRLRHLRKRGDVLTRKQIREAFEPPERGFTAAHRLHYKNRRDRWKGPLVKEAARQVELARAEYEILREYREHLREHIAFLGG